MSFEDSKMIEIDENQSITLKEYSEMTETEERAIEESSPSSLPASRVPRGYFYKDSYRAPEMERGSYIRYLHEEAVSSRYQDFSSLAAKSFIHQDRSLTIDFYFNDFKRVLQIFKTYYGEGQLVVINGFRSPHEIGEAPHSTGIAIDIHAEDRAHARRIMNAAYLAGIPTIIPNGEFYRGEGYVHLDIAPTADYAYDGGTYKGPWSK